MSDVNLAVKEWDKARAAETQAKSLVAEHSDNWTGEHQTEYENLKEAVMFHTERSRELSQMAQAVKESAVDTELRQDLTGMIGTGEAPANVLEDHRIEQNLREWVAADAPTVSPGFIELKPAEYQEYRDFIRQGGTAREWVEQVPLAVGTDGSGGNTVPTLINMNYHENLYRVNGIRSAGATVVTTTGGEPIELPKSRDFVLTAGFTRNTTRVNTLFTPEAQNATERGPTTSTVPFNVHKFLSYSRMSREIIEDSATNVQSMVGRQLGRTTGKLMELAYAQGEGGSDEPDGWNRTTIVANTEFSGAGNDRRLTAGSATALTYGDIVNLVYAVDDFGNWNENSFLMHKKVVGNLLSVVGSDGHPIWKLGPYMGGMENRRDTMGTILGYDVNLATFSGQLGTANDILALFGPMSEYYIRDVNSVEIRRWDQATYLSDQIDYTARIRTTGHFVNPDNFAWLRAHA